MTQAPSALRVQYVLPDVIVHNGAAISPRCRRRLAGKTAEDDRDARVGVIFESDYF